VHDAQSVLDRARESVALIEQREQLGIGKLVLGGGTPCTDCVGRA
jgi:hypothetical protein